MSMSLCQYVCLYMSVRTSVCVSVCMLVLYMGASICLCQYVCLHVYVCQYMCVCQKSKPDQQVTCRHKKKLAKLEMARCVKTTPSALQTYGYFYLSFPGVSFKSENASY